MCNNSPVPLKFCYLTFFFSSFFYLILFITAPPTFIERPRDQKVSLNGVVEFHCAATGNPPPSVFWSKEGSQLLMFPDTSYGHMHVSSQGTLRIQGVQREDAGFLVCSALSVAGSNTVRAFLQVIVRGFVLRGSLNVMFFLIRAGYFRS